VCVLCGIFVIIGGQLLPGFMNIILSANESQPRRLQISVEYFIDQEKYYYMLLFHINAAICIALTVMLATGTMLLVYLQHACGMFKVAR